MGEHLGMMHKKTALCFVSSLATALWAGADSLDQKSGVPTLVLADFDKEGVADGWETGCGK